MSELMEDASLMIDEASDLANQDKITEAVEKYKEAFKELERLERENPKRAATSEFSTVRNKKAYISAAIDSLLLDQASSNARAVAVTDTSEIEKRYAREQAAASLGMRIVDVEKEEKADDAKHVDDKGGDKEKEPVDVNPAKKTSSRSKTATAAARRARIAKAVAKNPGNRRTKVMLAAEDLKNKDYAAAELTIKDLLSEKPNDATALSLKAALEAAKGEYDEAKETLHQMIRSNPRIYSGYYNLARLIVRTEGESGKAAAGRYYETGRVYGGPVDESLEEILK